MRTLALMGLALACVAGCATTPQGAAWPEADAFVYAGKASLYWPRFVRVPLE